MTAALMVYALGVLVIYIGISGFSAIGSAIGSGGPGIPWPVTLLFSVLWPIFSILMILVMLYALVLEGIERCHSKKV